MRRRAAFLSYSDICGFLNAVSSFQSLMLSVQYKRRILQTVRDNQVSVSVPSGSAPSS